MRRKDKAKNFHFCHVERNKEARRDGHSPIAHSTSSRWVYRPLLHVKIVFIYHVSYGSLLVCCHRVVNKGCRLSPSAFPVFSHKLHPVFAPSSRPVFWHTSHPVFVPSSRPVFAPSSRPVSAPPSRPVFGLCAPVFAHPILRPLKLQRKAVTTPITRRKPLSCNLDCKARVTPDLRIVHEITQMVFVIFHKDFARRLWKGLMVLLGSSQFNLI